MHSSLLLSLDHRCKIILLSRDIRVDKCSTFKSFFFHLCGCCSCKQNRIPKFGVNWGKPMEPSRYKTLMVHKSQQKCHSVIGSSPCFVFFFNLFCPFVSLNSPKGFWGQYWHFVSSSSIASVAVRGKDCWIIQQVHIYLVVYCIWTIMFSLWDVCECVSYPNMAPVIALSSPPGIYKESLVVFI